MAPEQPVQTRRVRAALAGGAVALASLTILIDGHAVSGRPAATPVVYVGAAVLLSAWLVEALLGGRGRRWWLVVLTLVNGATVGWLGAFRRDDAAPLFLLLLGGWVGFSSGSRTTALVVGAAIVGLTPLALYEWPALLTWGIGVTLSSLTAHTIAEQRRLLAALRAAQADLARQATAAERRRIAREIHDVIAHALTVTMLHVTGARHVLQRDPARAVEALAEAERLGRQSLADVRRTVGLLGAEGEAQDGSRGPAAPPAPGLADIADLVAGYRRAGLDVGLALSGEATRVSAATGLGLYRIAQEALANAVRHAPGARVTVSLSLGAEAHLVVANDGGRATAPVRADGGRAGALGVAGMRDRAALLNGTLRAGPTDRGWTVECRVPVEAADADAVPVGERRDRGADSPPSRRDAAQLVGGEVPAVPPGAGLDRTVGAMELDGR